MILSHYTLTRVSHSEIGLQQTIKIPLKGSWSTLQNWNTSYEDIGVYPVKLLMSRQTCTMIPTHHRCLQLPQPVDSDRVAKGLQQYQSVSKQTYDKHSGDLPLLEPRDKLGIHPNKDRTWRKAEVLPKSYLLEDDQGLCLQRQNRRQII